MRILNQLKLFTKHLALALKLFFLDFESFDLFISAFGSFFKLSDLVLEHFFSMDDLVVGLLKIE